MSNTTANVAKIQDVKDGEMQQVSVGKTKILLVNIDGQIKAFGSNCTHYGAPLAEGIISGDRIVCPWHNACFSTKTGELQQPPGLDNLPEYEVSINGENVMVSIPEETPFECTPPMAKHDPAVDSRVFVILGTGVAGLNAAETLRKEGFQGRVVMITASEKLPYDRTMLSKAYLQGETSENALPLRSEEFYQEHDIEILSNTRVTRVDAKTKSIPLTDSQTIEYDALLLATGCKAAKLDVPGAELENIFTLRDHQDAEKIVDAAENAKNAVIIGSSFIGMETAASLTQAGLAVAVISPESVPFEKILGTEIGEMFRKKHEDKGVCFQFGTKATEFKGNGKVEAVVLEDGTTIDTDLVIVGIGVQPATDYLEGIELNSEDNSIPTNKFLQAGDGLYAAGDIASFPYWKTGKSTRIEHWRLAAQHGRIAAHNMLGNSVPFVGIPFFWSGQFDLKLRYVGHAEEWDEIIFDGNLSEEKFIAYYIKDDRVLAAAGCNRDQEIAAISELMRLDRMPTVDKLRQGKIFQINNGKIVMND
ncbi:MAG: FAD-dependent oxidoreductase [Cyanobacteriota bacterium]|nr:FAD-dependent oxidoreductase [Cyanobacteriota bacterium]